MTSEQPGDYSSDEASVDNVIRSTARLYDGIVDWYVEAFFDDLSDGGWLDQWIALLPDKGLVADIGAGPGNFAKYAASAGLRVVSSDVSVEMVRASARLVPDASPVVADMRRLPFRDAAFDGVLCAYSLMHVPAPANRRVLKEFARVLRVGGYLQLMLKTGIEPYTFSSPQVAGQVGIMEPWDIDELQSELSSLGLALVASDEASPSSPHEFDHQKLMVIGRLDA